MKTIVILAASFFPFVAARSADETSTDSAAPPPRVPAFSLSYMDRSIDPSTDFYRFADGQWLKDNPVPADKSSWGSFAELAERNWYLIHGILDAAVLESKSLPRHSPRREVGDFFASVMDTNRIETLGLAPIAADLKKLTASNPPRICSHCWRIFISAALAVCSISRFGPTRKTVLSMRWN